MFENQEEGEIERIIDKSSFSCSYCDKKFNRLNTLKEHEKFRIVPLEKTQTNVQLVTRNLLH